MQAQSTEAASALLAELDQALQQHAAAIEQEKTLNDAYTELADRAEKAYAACDEHVNNVLLPVRNRVDALVRQAFAQEVPLGALIARWRSQNRVANRD